MYYFCTVFVFITCTSRQHAQLQSWHLNLSKTEFLTDLLYCRLVVRIIAVPYLFTNNLKMPKPR